MVENATVRKSVEGNVLVSKKKLIHQNHHSPFLLQCAMHCYAVRYIYIRIYLYSMCMKYVFSLYDYARIQHAISVEC